ncbi:hypothetical protein H257_18902 [Aphanomyces astaci]|uniref:Uncharacterized protein n=1 Tax=Aphanomyces astaci TaxID=112090 RepID=W4FU68_APHAT|nr:hypothetical protein H257_13752 [Aphanomyces astaci]XP_009846343.1 hypothetical protein H257_18902 [Aphanomyces astaci]ETV64173.1 hypothetical protein H257_18902 [Aphanomyces astaci]ETV71035.1 hypothetical protein H257_13752 [Aphanomyces astaci]|eukprot:XP_009839698.1 hypothetical protein H257_13752 [Aphanomyces astaci]
MEYMNWQFGAIDVVTEMQIIIRGTRVAVSVTHAMTFKHGATFGLAEAKELLRKKLHGLVMVKCGGCPRQSYHRSVPHMWCQTSEIATVIASCYESVSIELGITANVVLTPSSPPPRPASSPTTLWQSCHVNKLLYQTTTLNICNHLLALE